MPENNNLKPTTFPMPIRFGEKPETGFSNNLESIRVYLKYYPSMDDLKRYLPDFVDSTWTDKPMIKKRTDLEKEKMIFDVFRGRLLPSALETIKLNFLLEGISYQDVSQILRYRTATFSAECSADKWWSHKDVVIPTSIENSPEFCERYKKLHEDMKQLYCDMIDSKEISLIDARYVLTRGMETYYWMSMDLATALNFIRHRIDKNIQPESDNVLAYKMWLQLISVYPLLVEIIDIHQPADFYIKTARTGRSTNLFIPDEDSDKYEWNREDYLYQRKRNEVNGTDKYLAENRKVFDRILKEVDAEIESVKRAVRNYYPRSFFE